MKIDITDFISFDRLKNGKVKITTDISKKGNLYKYLRHLGFCKSKLDNRRIYYRRENNSINPSSLQDIKHSFWELFQRGDFTNIPTETSYLDILNWYLDKQPIKENGFFDHYLKDSLSETEEHNYRLTTNPRYRHKFEIQQLLSKFSAWNFSKTTDVVGAFCKDNPLYFKRIDNKKYLIFNHYNSKSKSNEGFDSWLATFTDERQIGIKIQIQVIRFSFSLERDFELIKNYVN
jgi:hypothetical protein